VKLDAENDRLILESQPQETREAVEQE
jgi:hypothetical protein